jgi:hypothetical protein
LPLSPIPLKYSYSKLVESNSPDLIPLFVPLQEMKEIDCMNLIFLVHPSIKKLYTTKELLDIFVAKGIMDPTRLAVLLLTSSKQEQKYKQEWEIKALHCHNFEE